MINKLKYLHIYFPVIIVLWITLFIDSIYLSKYISYNQTIANIIVILVFIYIYNNVTIKVKKLMKYGVFLALAGEVFFSLVLGMYTYRLENLPIYVPFGHTLVYASIFYLSKEPIIKKHNQKIFAILYMGMILFSTYWFIEKNDTFGFICMLIILYLFRSRQTNRIFYILMFFMVLYLELVGTYYGCWIWPETWFNKIDFISSANPPSAISLFYFGFDLGCLWLYKKFNPKKWKRMKNIREIKTSKISFKTY
jgi:hypothetical protein